MVPVGGRRLVQSVPGELNMDHTAVLQKAEVSYTPATCHPPPPPPPPLIPPSLPPLACRPRHSRVCLLW